MKRYKRCSKKVVKKLIRRDSFQRNYLNQSKLKNLQANKSYKYAHKRLKKRLLRRKKYKRRLNVQKNRNQNVLQAVSKPTKLNL